MQTLNNNPSNSTNDMKRQEKHRHPQGSYGRRFNVDRPSHSQSGCSVSLNVILFRKPAGAYVNFIAINN